MKKCPWVRRKKKKKRRWDIWTQTHLNTDILRTLCDDRDRNHNKAAQAEESLGRLTPETNRVMELVLPQRPPEATNQTDTLISDSITVRWYISVVLSLTVSQETNIETVGILFSQIKIPLHRNNFFFLPCQRKRKLFWDRTRRKTEVDQKASL